MGAIWSLIQLINNLLQAWRAYQDAVAAKAERERQERKQKRESAGDESKKAETDDEIWKSQDDIVANRPKP